MGGGEKRADTVFLPLLLSTPRVMHVVGGKSTTTLLHTRTYLTQTLPLPPRRGILGQR